MIDVHTAHALGFEEADELLDAQELVADRPLKLPTKGSSRGEPGSA